MKGTLTIVCPIGDEVAEYRTYFATTGDFIRAPSGISSYDEFLERLAEKRVQSG